MRRFLRAGGFDLGVIALLTLAAVNFATAALGQVYVAALDALLGRMAESNDALSIAQVDVTSAVLLVVAVAMLAASTARTLARKDAARERATQG